MRKLGSVRALVVSLIAVAGSFACYQELIRPSIRFAEERKAIDQLLRRWWEGRPPPGVSESQWREAWVIAYNAFGNVCVSPKHVSFQELQRLKADLLAKIDQPATMASLRWFWKRLAETGPHGNQYIKQMTPLLDEAIRDG